jgi:hypothetical protein
MRAHELTPRPSLSDIDMVLRGVRELKSVTATFNTEAGTAVIRFYLDGNEGWMRVRAKPHGLKTAAEAMASRIRACATSQNRGRRPASMQDAIRSLRGNLGPNCIKMLVMNPEMDLVELKWDTVEYGIRH